MEKTQYQKALNMVERDIKDYREQLEEDEMFLTVHAEDICPNFKAGLIEKNTRITAELANLVYLHRLLVDHKLVVEKVKQENTINLLATLVALSGEKV